MSWFFNNPQLNNPYPQANPGYNGYDQPMPMPQQPLNFYANQPLWGQPQQPFANINALPSSLINLLLPALFSNANAMQNPFAGSFAGAFANFSGAFASSFASASAGFAGSPNPWAQANAFTNLSYLDQPYVNVSTVNTQYFAVPVCPPPAPVEVPKAKEKVFIIGGYNAKTWNANAKLTLGENIRDFNGTSTGEMDNRGDTYSGSSFHNNVKDNDKALTDLLSKMSEEDKKLPMERGEGYIISESGKVLGKINSVQALNNNEKAYWQTDKHNFVPTVEKNHCFQVLEALGVDSKDADMSSGLDATSYNNNVQKAGGEEALGGKIKFNGQIYDVASTIIRKSTPLTFDLNGDGVKTSNKIIDYDIDGDGKLDKINDVADGTLSIRGGKSGLDVFGDNTDLDGDGKADGFKNGFDALKALAKKEGLINGKEDMKLDANDLKVLEDKYQLGMKTEGYNSKEKSLASLGITEINLGATDEVTEKTNFDGQNNDILLQEGATFNINGTQRDYADVLHEKK